MTLREFVEKYEGQTKGYPNDNQFRGECLSIVKLYILEVFHLSPPPSGSNSAYGYWSNFPNPLGEVFEKVENTPDLIPEYGWIVIWKPWKANKYGHIAIVDKGCTKTTLKNLAQNWTSKMFQRETQKYTNVIGYLKPKNKGDDMTEEQKRILQVITENKLSEGDVRQAVGWFKDKTVSNLEKKVSELEANLKSVEAKMGEFEAKFIEKDELVADYQKRLETANKNIDKQNKINEELATDRDTWRKRYNDKNSQFNEEVMTQVDKIIGDKTGWQLIKLGFKKLFIK